MKEFLKNYYQIETVDCHIIQYGGLEYAVKHHQEGNLCVLVDFAHGKPMFHIATDHHDKQSGAEETQSTYFKQTRSNVETISGEISYADIFTHEDIELIKTVDSANFIANNIKPEDVQNAIFSPDRSVSPTKNRFMMGFVVNRLLLAYKNKRITVKSMDGKRNHINRNILECLTLDSTGSLYSMFNNLKNYINNAKTNDKLGRLATPEEITDNLNAYIGRMKNYSFIEDPTTGDVTEYDPSNWRHKKMLDTGAQIGKGVHFDEDYKIVTQYGGGSMIKPGSYDRYVVFKNNPEADFNCIAWPMGLLQVSCNPFKKERELKGVNLGEIAQEVVGKWEDQLKQRTIPLSTIKWVSETSVGPESIGFTFKDFEALYGDKFTTMEGGEKVLNHINDMMETPFKDLTEEHKEMLDKIGINAWDLIQSNSGGHKCITNISGLNYLGRGKRPPQGQYRYDSEKDDSPSVKFTKMIANEFEKKLKEKIAESK